MPELTQETIDEKDRELLLWVALGLTYDVRIFAERLGQQINQLRRSGVDEQSIIRILSEDLGGNRRVFGELRNSIKRGVVGGINQAFRRSGTMGRKLKWITISKNVCPDCESRAGQVDTLEGWEAQGLPSTGWSVCREYCYCQLIPEDIEIDDKLRL